MIASKVSGFSTYIVKIASRCNLNCSYCYMYNLADQSWKNKPFVLDDDNIILLAQRLNHHLQLTNCKWVRILLHGGEPTLAGYEKLSFFLTQIKSSLRPEIKIEFGMQTNATLLTSDILDLLVQHNVRTGVSLDGDREVNDIYRVDHQGKGSYDRMKSGLELITSPKYEVIFSGFLCVINPQSNPLNVYKHLISFKPKCVDFLFRDYTYETFPNEHKNKTVFADWLIQIFDYWYQSKDQVKIRLFTTIMKLLLGQGIGYDAIGLSDVGLLVIETDGSIEGVDVLKATDVGGTLNAHLKTHSFEELISHYKMSYLTNKAENLSETCKSCQLVRVCGGGYLPHRFSSQNGFDNPSVYCQDLQKLILHIHSVIHTELISIKENKQ